MCCVRLFVCVCLCVLVCLMCLCVLFDMSRVVLFGSLVGVIGCVCLLMCLCGVFLAMFVW